jgi:hypothetical protein
MRDFNLTFAVNPPLPMSTQPTSCATFPEADFKELLEAVRGRSVVHINSPVDVCPAVHRLNDILSKIKDQNPAVCTEVLTDFLSCLQMDHNVPTSDPVTCTLDCDYGAQGCVTSHRLVIKASQASAVCKVDIHVNY